MMKKQTFHIPEGVEIREYQQQAITNWKNNGFIGVYDMATGTGKTITAILSAHALYEHNKERLGIVILCPYQHLVNQWLMDLEKFGIDAIVGYSGNPFGDYVRHLESKIIQFNKGKSNFFVFITTNHTFKKNEIQYLLKSVSGKLLLIADEAHHLGAEINKKYLTDTFDYRLGLSATFERYWDKVGTIALYDFFDKNVFSYGLDEAIKNGVLVPYEYHPIICYLEPKEYNEYIKLSRELKKHIIHKDEDVELTAKGKMILIQRAKVVAAATNKIDKLVQVVTEYKNKNSMLFYCGVANLFETDIKQLDYVTDLLTNKFAMKIKRFTCNENSSERKTLLNDLKSQNIQGLTAIRCLDEGVNVPNIETAFILASSRNPKEYIQRRGRVLRKSPGKEKAVIYDFVTLPYEEYGIAKDILVSGTKYDLTLVKGELFRIEEFADLAINKSDIDEVVTKIRKTFGLNNKVTNQEVEIHDEI